MNAAEARGVTIHFGERCMGFDAATGAARFRNEETERENRVEANTLIGTDGSASAIQWKCKSWDVSICRRNISTMATRS